MSSRLLSFSLLPVFLLLLAGCAGDSDYSPWYHRVRATDYQGNLISEWVAHGRVHRTEHGFRFTAIERISPPPSSQYLRYPEGRPSEAVGPNVFVARCAEPTWHYWMHHERTSANR